MNKNTQDNGEKFFFNLNIFDDDDEAETQEEDLEREEKEAPSPPPPTFSEEELAAAQKKAFEQGRAEALEESKNARAQKTTDLIALISQSISPLLEAEAQREKIYEMEAVSLSLAIFEKLFPIYAEKHQFAELKESICTVLTQQDGQKNIMISVAPEDEEELKKSLENTPHSTLKHIVIKGDDRINPGACALSWEDGGAVKDITALSEKIEALLLQALKGHAVKNNEESLSNTPKKVHNGSEEINQTDTQKIESLEEDSFHTNNLDDHAVSTTEEDSKENETNALTEETDER